MRGLFRSPFRWRSSMTVRIALVTLLIALAVSVTSNLSGADGDILVIDQNYNIVESGKDGPSAKDVRQVLYFSKDMICIDEMGGRDSKPTESIVLDMKAKKIVNLNHVDRKMVTEDFDTRREKIKKKKDNVREDMKNNVGAQKERMEKLFRSMLDDNRKFALDRNPRTLPAKTIAGVECKSVRVVDTDDPGYFPLEAYLHPELEMPHENAEVLYLIMIIGEKMSEFLKRNKDTLRKVPMELHLDLAAGGHLDTQVISVKKVPHSKLDLAQRGNLGDPFVIPEYDVRQLRPTQPKVNDRPD